MKPLLAILGSLSVGISPAIATISSTPTYNKNSQTQLASAIWSEPTSMQALQEGINKQYESTDGPKDWGQSIESKVQSVYDLLFANKTANLSVLEMIPVAETIDETFQDTYLNNTPNKQTFQTHSYSEEVTDTTTFNIQLKDDVNVSFTASFMFASTTVSANFSSTRAWTDTQTVKKTVTAPSQPFTVDPYSKGIASYIIRSGTYNVTAAARLTFDLNMLMGSSVVTGSGAVATYKLKEIIRFLNDAGYGDMMRMDSKKFSVITTDNPDNPTTVSLNFPVNYVSKGAKMDVEFTQEPLS